MLGSVHKRRSHKILTGLAQSFSPLLSVRTHHKFQKNLIFIEPKSADVRILTLSSLSALEKLSLLITNVLYGQLVSTLFLANVTSY